MTLCQICGDKGKSKYLIHCVLCHISAEHRYCQEKWPRKDYEAISWTCEDCIPKDAKPKQNPSRKSERITVKKERVDEVRMNRKWIKNETSIFTPQVHMDMSPHNEDCGNQELKKPRPDLEDGKGFEEKCEAVKDEETFYDETSLPDENCGRQRRKFVCEDEESFYDETSILKAKVDINTSPRDPIYGNQELRKRRRRLVLQDEESEQVPGSEPSEDAQNDGPKCSQPPLVFSGYALAQPIMDPIWRGYFSMDHEGNKSSVELVAHVSSKACSRVLDAAKALPPMLDVKILPRCDAWPPSFHRSPPKDDNIALYFFPNERDERVFDGMVDDIIEKDLALKIVIDNVELLIFSSRELPEQHWRLQRKYYMWGVFRNKPIEPTEQQPVVQNSSFEYVTPSKSRDDSGSKQTSHVSDPRISLCDWKARKFSSEYATCYFSKNVSADNAVEAREQQGNQGNVNFQPQATPCGGSLNAMGRADFLEPCLKQFPLIKEDLALVTKARRINKLDLALGLSQFKRDDGRNSLGRDVALETTQRITQEDCRCSSTMYRSASSAFGKTIF